MAIGKTENNKGAGESIESLEGRYAQVIENIRKIKSGRKDIKDIPEAEKSKLRTEYLRAAQLAHTLSQRVTNDEKRALYDKQYNDLTAVAANYGSVIKSKVPSTTFDDVKGLDSVKNIVKSFMFMAQHDDILKYYKIEGGLGMLMYGAPGTGKTMFAEAIANAMNLPLFIVTPADIFKSYVGESEQAVRQIFQELDMCPDGAILFVDECESIFSRRTQDTKDYKAAVTTELLQRINGFGVDGSKRIMIAATNRPEIIDPAYLRYKRFSHLVHVPPPDYEAKKSIIASKLDGIALSGITLEEIYDMTESYSYESTSMGKIAQPKAFYSAADLCGIVEEACRLALEQMQKTGATMPIPLTREMFEKAFSKTPPSISYELYKQYEDFH